MGWPPTDEHSAAAHALTRAELARLENRIDAGFARLQNHIDHTLVMAEYSLQRHLAQSRPLALFDSAPWFTPELAMAFMVGIMLGAVVASVKL
jgi:hypothetical protein